MTDELRAQIKQLIEVNGPMGVNAIQREVGIPLSTLQKYLDLKQNYFVKTDSRKWDLPESMAAQMQVKAIDNFESVINNNIASIRALMNSAMVQLEATLMLINANKNTSTPVAYSPKPMHNKEENNGSNKPITTPSSVVPNLLRNIRTHRANMTDQVYFFLKDINWKLLEEDMGKEYILDNMGNDLSNILLGKQEHFSHEIRDSLDPYIK